MEFDYIVVGAGFAGATLANKLASVGKKVLVIDKRKTIGGNMYDYKDENGIIIHKYGPHLFHTNLENVYNYLCSFGKWFNYEHRVLGMVNKKVVPIPFNLTSIKKSFDEKLSTKLIDILKTKFGMEKKIPILELRKYPDKDINKLADYIYQNVFLYYTMKQWGKTPDEIDPNVTSRVPVYVSVDDRYFQDKYQCMPVGGFTGIFKEMLAHDNITVKLNTSAKDVLKFTDKIYYQGNEFQGKVIYTGPIDELFAYQDGVLPYRSLDFEFEEKDVKYYQDVATVNYPTKEDKFTRITEYKHMTITNGDDINKTVIMREYPKAFNKNNNDIPYYPIENDENKKMYEKYLNRCHNYNNLYLVGRLAQYKYYNMDLVINEALKLFDELEGE